MKLNTETERQRDRKTERQRDRQRGERRDRREEKKKENTYFEINFKLVCDACFPFSLCSGFGPDRGVPKSLKNQ